MPSKRILVCLVIAASCTFGAQRNILTSGDVSSVTALAADIDGEGIFVGDSAGWMRYVDPATGSVLGSYWLWMGASAAPVGMTPDGENTNRAWAMHADGWVVNWLPGPALGEYFKIPIYAGVARTYCDIDHTNHGDFYVSTVDDGVGTLWRRDGDTEIWGPPVELTTPGCPRIAHDMYTDELYVLHGNGLTFEKRDSETMLSPSYVPLQLWGGSLNDADVWGGELVGGGGGAAWPPGRTTVWTLDPDTGAQQDSWTINGGVATAVQITVNSSAMTSEMLIGAGSGTNTLRGILLNN